MITRPLLLVANWKMNLDVFESVERARLLAETWQSLDVNHHVQCVVCPSFDALTAVGDELQETSIVLGAQDIFWQDKGSYTGEVSGRMLTAAGCSYVIIGHSERRRHAHEDDAMINMKVHAALRAGLTPILCVGETYDERAAGLSDRTVARQVIEGLQGISLSEASQIVVAYEPLWVIGTGHAIEPGDAVHASHIIEQALIDLFPSDTIAQHMRIIYGGSVDEKNIMHYIKLPLLTGSLVGTASLYPDRFIRIIRALL